jgi:hypothetical protein
MKRPNAYATARGSEKRKVDANRTWVLLLIGSHSDTPCTNPRITAKSGFTQKANRLRLVEEPSDFIVRMKILG